MARSRKLSNEQLLTVARRVIFEQGIQVTTRNLAKEMGISEGVIFQRFGSKEELLRAALTPPEIQVTQLVEQASIGKYGREMIENISAAIYRAFRQLFPFYIPLLRQAETVERAVWTSRGSVFQLFVAALEEQLKGERHAGRISTESAYTTSYLIVSILHHAAMSEAITGPSAGINEGFVRDLIGVVWTGLQTAKKA
jgi:AcrR family transcriptional regulator